MSSKSEMQVLKKQTQEPSNDGAVGRMQQMLLPMVAGIAATKRDFTDWIHDKGLEALDKLLREDAERIAGPKGKHRRDRSHYHWGRPERELTFGGRRIQVQRPRVRSTSGREAPLPCFEEFRQEDPLPERVVNQILLAVSTRGYETGLGEPLPQVPHRGTSKSAASRHLVSETKKKLEAYLSRRLDELKLVVLVVDDIEVAGHTVAVSLGITTDAKKVPLGLWLGSTENARLCTALLQDLLERGLRIDGRVLCVVDGGRGIRKALADVLGDVAVIQRCAG